MTYPDAVEPDKVGSYPALSFAGGGYVWDEVLEYRVWCRSGAGPGDLADSGDHYYAFATFAEAQLASQALAGAQEPLALILQRGYIDEIEPGMYRHVEQERVTEWPVEFLTRPQRDGRTIPDFLAPDAPPNRLEILRGQAPRPR